MNPQVSMSAFKALSEAAARQSGLVTAGQARRIGISSAERDALVDAGLLIRPGWSVYQVVGTESAPWYMYKYAAWLALDEDAFAWERPSAPGEDAVVSHETACEALGITGPASRELVFTAPDPRSAPPGVRVRRAVLGADEIQVVGRLPVTTPHRTLVDLVRDWNDADDLRRAFSDAVRKDLVDLLRLHLDLVPLADEYGFPAEGGRFVDYFLTRVGIASLPLRNLVGYVELKWPQRVAAVRTALTEGLREAGDPGGALLAEDEAFGREIAAQVVGRAAADE
ncbi:type IV toxin-antitoxin system AbiEi family antitoxin domain-containing protein [Streptomonospora sp. PA3]|uniref:type IV toxin-antitoxin system AbiEi family antitoxin domain-containing protein n=1 Tax=Streptomonospora sp. PA3 TaxID=2607326 RepID=UPI0012DCA0DF|nr:type IV toxin-antitoxin system AbiEi family antitoxin domain-containing protein [Streptomonospora sp. PA3]